ncbi:MAG: lactoylglutathione lyase [Pseudooceanicola sp.]|nr:lactoylglutathione lyase [Pseudooceanicola sp.]
MNVFINLCIQDVARSRAFFTALGFAFNEQFCTEDTLGMQIGETAFAMLLLPSKFQTFTPRSIVDPTKSTEVLIALQQDSKAAVDAMIATAVAAGGAEFRPAEDHGFMYGRSFCDPDGHVWETFWFDASTLEGQA